MSHYYDELTAQGGGNRALVDGWRHRLEQWLRFEVVRRGLSIGTEASVADVGCGTGRLLAYLGVARPGHYVGVDLREEVVDQARKEYRDANATFIASSWSDRAVDEAGPFDFAVAIGTMVDGVTSDASQRRRQLRELMSRLHELGASGWALVALNQTRLEADPVRSLEPYLKGARAEEVDEVLDELGVDAVVDRKAVPTDLVVIHRGGEASAAIGERIAGDDAHEAVLERARKYGDIDGARRVWFWMTTGRLQRARRALETMPDSHLRKKLLSEQLRLRGA